MWYYLKRANGRLTWDWTNGEIRNKSKPRENWVYWIIGSDRTVNKNARSRSVFTKESMPFIAVLREDIDCWSSSHDEASTCFFLCPLAHRVIFGGSDFIFFHHVFHKRTMQSQINLFPKHCSISLVHKEASFASALQKMASSSLEVNVNDKFHYVYSCDVDAYLTLKVYAFDFIYKEALFLRIWWFRSWECALHITSFFANTQNSSHLLSF